MLRPPKRPTSDDVVGCDVLSAAVFFVFVGVLWFLVVASGCINIERVEVFPNVRTDVRLGAATSQPASADGR